MQSTRIDTGKYLFEDRGVTATLEVYYDSNLPWTLTIDSVQPNVVKKFAQKKIAKSFFVNYVEKNGGENAPIVSSTNVKAPMSRGNVVKQEGRDIARRKAEQAALERPAEDIRNEQAKRFQAVSAMANMTMLGKNRALIVSGSAGIGKTYTIETMAEDLTAKGLINYEMVKGSITSVMLYCLLYKCKDKDAVLILDDCDMVFFEEKSLNLLKAVLDTGKRRRVSWHSKSRLEQEMFDGTMERVPPTFDFNGSVIFLTNYDFEEIIEKRSNKLVPHLEALMSRAHYISVDIRTLREKMIRVAHVVHTTGALVGFGLSRVDIDEIVRYMADNVLRLREVSIRTALKIAMLYTSNPSDWKDMAEVTCMKKAR